MGNISYIGLGVFFWIIIPIGLIFLFSLIFKNSFSGFSREDGEIVLKRIYVYLVMFVTLMMSIGGSVGVFTGIAEYISPSVYYESYSEFKETKLNSEVYQNGNIALTEEGYQEAMKQIDEEQIKAEYEIMKNEKFEKAKQDAIGDIIRSLGWIVIPFPIFLYFHFSKSRKEEI